MKDTTMALQLLDALPVDALDAVSCFLTGWDLFQLSHANAQCWRHFSQPSHWSQRLKDKSPPACSAKRAYAQTRSFAFQGLRLDERLRHCGGTNGSSGVVVQGASTGGPFTEAFTHGSSFSVDTWFSLLDGEGGGVLTGGVLFGGQSPLMPTCTWTNHHVAFVGVDGDRNLFCSMLEGCANCVVTGMDFKRWYHLILSYERGVQRVYLDEELVSEMEGVLHHSWRRRCRSARASFRAFGGRSRVSSSIRGPEAFARLRVAPFERTGGRVLGVAERPE